jgi:hypothetical protein
VPKLASYEVPAEFAVRAVDLIGMLVRGTFADDLQSARTDAIARRDEVKESLLVDLLPALGDESKHPAVPPVDVAARRHSSDRGGYGIDDPAKLPFVLSPCFLGRLHS